MLRRLIPVVCVLVGMTSNSAKNGMQAAETTGPIYELRTYHCEPGKLPALEERFRNHTIQLFEKHGIRNLAYWTPAVDATSPPVDTLVYLLEYPSRKAAQESWEHFRADPDWKRVTADSAAKHGKILARPPESVFLCKTDYSPEIGPPKAGKIYELRIYQAAPGKLEALHARFRQHTDALFQKHGMQAYGYWAPLDPPASTETLIYLLEFPDRTAVAERWDAFRNDPEWKKAFADSQVDGPLTSRRPDSLLLIVEPFSPVAK